MIEIIPNAGELDTYAKLAEEKSLGFEYDDFYVPDLLDDKTALKQRIALYRGLGRPEGTDTLHGAFFDIVPFSWDGGIRRHSLYRMQQSVEIACELGCRGVVFHTGLLPGMVGDKKYRDNFLKTMEETIRRLLEQGGELQIYCENMFDKTPAELKDLALRLQDEKRFGICLDVAHMVLFGEESGRWFQELSPHIRHFHLNDNHLKHDEHLALGRGGIDWGYIFRLMGDYKLWDASMLLEMNGLDKIRESLDFLNHLLLRYAGKCEKIF